MAATGRQPAVAVEWHAQYEPAVKAAAAEHRLLFLWFFDPHSVAENERFAEDVLGQTAIADVLAQRLIAAKLPLNAQMTWEADPLPLVGHPAFAELRRQPGVAIVDFSDREGAHYGHVVSIYPFSRGPIGAAKLAVLLDLPQGSLTQRTLIYAVRTHPEAPTSTAGHLSSMLMRETASHAAHQARINLQGHHQWEQRFHAINAQLPAGLVAQEVCAESWPGQDLVAAAEECVASWRQSPGHWEAVSRRHALFGYDMQLGSNGVWYAAGIFAREH
jgi:hypothetical protein